MIFCTVMVRRSTTSYLLYSKLNRYFHTYDAESTEHISATLGN